MAARRARAALCMALLVAGLSSCRSRDAEAQPESRVLGPVRHHVTGTLDMHAEDETAALGDTQSRHPRSEAAGRTLALALHTHGAQVHVVATGTVTAALQWRLPLRDLDSSQLDPLTLSLGALPPGCEVERQWFSDVAARVGVTSFVADFPHQPDETDVPGHAQYGEDPVVGPPGQAPQGYERLGSLGREKREWVREQNIIRMSQVGHHLRYADRDVRTALLARCQQTPGLEQVIDLELDLKAGWNMIEHRDVIEMPDRIQSSFTQTSTLRVVPLSTPVQLTMAH